MWHIARVVGRRNGRRTSGFSLIEIMIAVVIIGILVVMITPQLLRASGRAQNTACGGNVRTISAALAEYQLIHGQLPSGNSAQQIQALVSDGLLTNDALSGNYTIQDSDANNISVTCLSPGGM
ncbi:prepilin-type N-terminal cleavage/methylation domain-containing protein [Alicyclobacillus mali]|uniref:Prepilin-type N-terminal cleavage/methylation domain-containing protein n=1 Tax=Alicyclobacillus mali (ex Roth et al. 2021) TaxID=1123961 RepID=A0ABS0F618_9BACL|nr:prepilin-type N-terminal cleavage/methylation domain-containing protein [Alicyclobacillus mali (ex Roth et al. 2021)]MBF8378734.1 prepilin-type N-terminal cleavage/methylation domain-containing protein [Alicyclobacillus mali (ex Roth et al. 2021)]MCL6488225.1 prepilin-type N-terminal cleavage/methylation domain-containing protein [Alicyclobacillus mali (ex Roth et al. 2021)]